MTSKIIVVFVSTVLVFASASYMTNIPEICLPYLNNPSQASFVGGGFTQIHEPRPNPKLTTVFNTNSNLGQTQSGQISIVTSPQYESYQPSPAGNVFIGGYSKIPNYQSPGYVQSQSAPEVQYIPYEQNAGSYGGHAGSSVMASQSGNLLASHSMNYMSNSGDLLASQSAHLNPVASAAFVGHPAAGLAGSFGNAAYASRSGDALVSRHGGEHIPFNSRVIPKSL